MEQVISQIHAAIAPIIREKKVSKNSALNATVRLTARVLFCAQDRNYNLSATVERVLTQMLTADGVDLSRAHDKELWRHSLDGYPPRAVTYGEARREGWIDARDALTEKGRSDLASKGFFHATGALVGEPTAAEQVAILRTPRGKGATA